MPAYQLANIKDWVKGELLQGDENSTVRHLVLDSRKITKRKHALFIAIRGEYHNGHHFVNDAYKEGIRNFVIDELVDLSHLPQANVVRVNNSISALQQIAASHRLHFDYPVIGITGSNGKTIVKEWLFQLLEKDYKIVRSPNSYNSQIGVPLSVWQMEEAHNLAIFEAGISKAGEMGKLEQIIRPTIGLITNIGSAHNEGFETEEQKINEKLELFKRTPSLLYSKKYTGLQKCIRKRLKSDQTFGWSEGDAARLIIHKKEIRGSTTLVEGVYDGLLFYISIPFIDDASVENAIHCWNVLLYLGYSEEEIQWRLTELSGLSGRLEMKNGSNNCTLINDTYNSDVESIEIALDFLKLQKQNKNHSLILSDILQSGEDERELYARLSELIADKGLYRFVGIGEGISRHQELFQSNFAIKQFFADTESFIRSTDAAGFNNETILVKGARKFGLEKVVDVLGEKNHQTVFEVNLSKLIDNLRFFRKKLKPSTKIMAMVKAFSYGSGTHEIASILAYHKVDYLAVAYTDEGVTLREKGIDTPIVVMNAHENDFGQMVKYKLEAAIYSDRLLYRLLQYLNSKSITAFPIHIKLDTGMHRLGFNSIELDNLCSVLSEQSKRFKLISLFSHLASSDEKRLEGFTRGQFDHFKKMTNQIESTLGMRCMKHLLNTSGIIHYPEYQMDMVRLGIGLYGIDPTHSASDELKPVSTLKTYITQLRTLKQGSRIGYGCKGYVDKQSLIATISIGYGDGFPRRAGNGQFQVMVQGKLVPTVGSICMDMCMIDVSTLPKVRVGDEVIIFDDAHPVENLARQCETIPYEILATVSGRVKRIYFQE